MNDRRPTKVLLDCATGRVYLAPLDDDELADYNARQAEPDPAAPEPPPDAVTIARALVDAVNGAPDFDSARKRLAVVAAELPDPPKRPTEGG